MLLKGSGEVLMAARLVALAAKLVAASVPPSRAATSAPRPLSAPNTAAAKRRAGRDADHAMHHVPQRIQAGDLVGKNSMNTIKPLTPSTTGCASSCSPAGSGTQPIKPARPVSSTTR
jgi:hypothetical protein